MAAATLMSRVRMGRREGGNHAAQSRFPRLIRLALLCLDRGQSEAVSSCEPWRSTRLVIFGRKVFSSLSQQLKKRPVVGESTLATGEGEIGFGVAVFLLGVQGCIF